MIIFPMDKTPDPANAIKQYLALKKMSYREFSRLCNISSSTIVNVLKRNVIQASTAQKIEDGTEAEIKFEDLTNGKRPDYYIARLRTRDLREKLKNLL